MADNLKNDISVTGLSGRYAKALYDLAESGSSTNEVEKDSADLSLVND